MQYRRLALGLLFAATACACSIGSSHDEVSNKYALLDDVSSAPANQRAALQKCLATPDLPNNQWQEHAGKARCWLMLSQQPSLEEIAATLAEPDGAGKLDREYKQILAAHHRDPMHRELLFRAYSDFQSEQGRQLATDWLKKSPTSPFAQMAVGDAAIGAARDARGGKYAGQTSQAQFDAMTAQLRIAVPLLQSAQGAEPNLSTACVGLIDAGMLDSDASTSVPALRHCMQVDPLSWHVNEQWLRSIDPRWGGTFDQLDEAVNQIRLHVADSPMLASLLAKAIGRRAYLNFDSSDLSSIATNLDRAALAAPDPFYIAKAGEATQQSGDRHKALQYVTQALRFAPEEPNFLIQRGTIRQSLGYIPAALADARKAAAMPSDQCNCNYGDLATLFGNLHQIPEQRIALERDIATNLKHEWALQTLCNTYFDGYSFDSVPGMACTKRLADEFPDNTDAMYVRAMSLYIVHDPAAAQFDARFRKLADASDAEAQMQISQLDRLKSGQLH